MSDLSWVGVSDPNFEGEGGQRMSEEQTGLLDVRISRDVTRAYSISPEPDPDWTHTDSNGHQHYRDGSAYPTLQLVTTDLYWCSDCRDEHEEAEWRCVECGEKVEPGTRMPNPLGTPVFGPWDADAVLNDEGPELFTHQIGSVRLLFRKTGYERDGFGRVKTFYAGVSAEAHHD